MNQFINNHMQYTSLKLQRNHHKAWKLLASINGPFVIAFLYREFVDERIREIGEYELISKLRLFLEEQAIETEKSAKEYLNDWSSDEYGLLRKYYPYGSDDVHYDLTAEGQKAIDWAFSLKQESFIGNESRLISVFHLLNDIISKTNVDPEERIEELRQQKQKIDEEIAEIKLGKIEVLDDTQIKERYIQVMRLSREIVSDFRQVEQNFRQLERNMKEDIATWDKSKGELLSNFFSQEESIEESEQGKSFNAFWRFLTSTSQHDEFYKLINQSLQLECIQKIIGHKEMLHVESQWQKESKHVQNTIAMISKQLKRYLDNDFLDEEKRISQIIIGIEKLAIEIKETPPKQTILELDSFQQKIKLPLERPLFTPPIASKLNDDAIEDGIFDASIELLFNQLDLDKEELLNHIQELLEYQSKVTLKEVINKYPLKYGLGELMLYIQIANEFKNTSILENEYEVIIWIDEFEQIRKTKIPKIIYEGSVI